MKKIVIMLISFVVFLSACSSNKKHDFINVDFGISSLELIETEGEPDVEFPTSDDVTLYSYFNREAFGVGNATLGYYVDINGVGGANVVYNNQYPDNKSYLLEYQTIKENLIDEWGKPIEVSESEDDFNYSCSWGTKFLELYRDEDNSVILKVRAYQQEYYELHIDKQTSDTE